MDVKRDVAVIDTAKRRRDGKIPKWREEDFYAIVSMNADAMVVLDREGFILYVNQAAESLFNLPSAEMVGALFGFPLILDEPVEMYILREYKDFVAAEMRMVEVVWAGEPSYLLSFRDLTDRIQAEQAMSEARYKLESMVNERTHELTEANELLKGEIAERKRAEKTLMDSEKRFRDILETASEGIWILDKEYKIIFVNSNIARMLGYSLEELMGRSPLEFVDKYYSKLAKSILDNRKKGLTGSTDIKFRRKDGSEMWARISSSPRFTDGIFDGVLEMVTDVTDDKRIALKMAWLASFPESSPDPIIEIDRYGHISYSNQIANNLFPDLRTTGLGHPFLAEINMIFAQLHKRGDTVASRELWVGASCYEQVFSYHIEADILRIYGRNITYRKRVEEELKAAKAQAELYVDLMGHDINNMNQTAMGYLELALQELETEKMLMLDDRVLLEKPMQSLANSSALIDNVRMLQKLMMQDIKTKPIDLQNIFREVEGTSFHSDDRDVTINIQHVSGYSVEANELIKDVFVNLISNAIKHSDKEKPLIVNVKVEAVNENGKKFYKCMVEDNGPGIPDQMKNKLFHRFQRGETQALGKGLGLYIVRTLVEGYNGRVCVEDRMPGDHTKGARFVVMLPAVVQ